MAPVLRTAKNWLSTLGCNLRIAVICAMIIYSSFLCAALAVLFYLRHGGEAAWMVMMVIFGVIVLAVSVFAVALLVGSFFSLKTMAERHHMWIGLVLLVLNAAPLLYIAPNVMKLTLDATATEKRATKNPPVSRSYRCSGYMPSYRAQPPPGLWSQPKGMTWGVVCTTPQPDSNSLVSCFGYGLTPDGDHACNITYGDTDCREQRPVLCVGPATKELQDKPRSLPRTRPTEGWSGRDVQLSVPVQGLTLTSRAAADDFCATQFGPDWRMADWGDGALSEGEHAETGFWGRADFAGVKDRFWVAGPNDRTNCWSASRNKGY